MYYTGFADEAGADIDTQIKATLELGWKNIESRKIGSENIHDIPEKDFEYVCEKLDESGVKINCFGSSVANWGKDPLSDEDFEKSKEELARALSRMERLGTKMIRAMSFRRFDNADDITPEIEKRIFSQVKYLVGMCEDAGVMYMHENCMNYGGMSWRHTLRLIENVDSDSFRLVFDTGNPVMTYDYSRPKPYPKQDSWEFYSNTRDFIEYVHIKDPVYISESGKLFPKAEHKFPGEGDADVEKIVRDLIENGYDGGFSIEPHMQLVFHEDTPADAREDALFSNYVEYGRRLMRMIDGVTG